MRVLKWLGGFIGVLVLAAVAGVLYFKSSAQAKLDRTFEVEVPSVQIPYPLTEQEIEALRAERLAARKAEQAQAAPAEGEAAPAEAEAAPEPDPLEGVDLNAIALERSIARGKHYLSSRAGCADCHGEDFGGKVVVENPAMGSWIAPNITRGGVTKDYEPEDWIRTVRHGVKPNGKPAMMPSLDFTWFSDQEIADIAAYIHSLPPVERVMPPSELGPVFSMLIANGTIPISADVLDHTTPRAKTAPALEPTMELGKHLGATCMGCHGMGFSGGPILGGDPAWPEARNITFHETGLGAWSLDDFKKAMREGVRPDGSKIQLPMPIAFTSKLQDAEVEALYLYLQSVEKKPYGNH